MALLELFADVAIKYNKVKIFLKLLKIGKLCPTHKIQSQKSVIAVNWTAAVISSFHDYFSYLHHDKIHH